MEEIVTKVFQEPIDVNLLLAWMAPLISIFISVGTYLILWKKAKPEIDKIKAETSSEDATAAESYARAAKTYAEELESVRQELANLRREIDSRDKLILEQGLVIEDLKDWAQRLIFQVKSLNGNPVPLRSTSRAKTRKTLDEIEKDVLDAAKTDPHNRQ